MIAYVFSVRSVLGWVICFLLLSAHQFFFCLSADSGITGERERGFIIIVTFYVGFLVHRMNTFDTRQ